MIFVTNDWGTLLKALNQAGFKTRSARGFRGAVNEDDEIVSTSWIDSGEKRDQLRITRPLTNHGGLRDAWDLGRIEAGATIRVILIRQRGDEPWGQGKRNLKDAVFWPGFWKVVEVRDNPRYRKEAVIEQVQ